MRSEARNETKRNETKGKGREVREFFVISGRTDYAGSGSGPLHARGKGLGWACGLGPFVRNGEARSSRLRFIRLHRWLAEGANVVEFFWEVG